MLLLTSLSVVFPER